MNAALIASILGTIISIVGFSRLAIRNYVFGSGKTLSELAAKDNKTLRNHGIILWVCASLFTFSVFQLIVPNLEAGFWLGIAWIIGISCELLLPFIPASSGLTKRIHNFLAFSMVSGMALVTFLFSIYLNGLYAIGEIIIFILMFIVGITALKLRKHFIYFQLPYIYLSNLSVIVAVLGVLNT